MMMYFALVRLIAVPGLHPCRCIRHSAGQAVLEPGLPFYVLQISPKSWALLQGHLLHLPLSAWKHNSLSSATYPHSLGNLGNENTNTDSIGQDSKSATLFRT